MYYIRELARIQKQDIENPAYQLRFAKLYLRMGQYGLARKNFESLLEVWQRRIPASPSQDRVELHFYFSLLLNARVILQVPSSIFVLLLRLLPPSAMISFWSMQCVKTWIR